MSCEANGDTAYPCVGSVLYRAVYPSTCEIVGLWEAAMLLQQNYGETVTCSGRDAVAPGIVWDFTNADLRCIHEVAVTLNIDHTAVRVIRNRCSGCGRLGNCSIG